MRLPPQPERREDRTRRKAKVRPGTGMEEESVFSNPAMRLHVAGIVYRWYSAANICKSRVRRPGFGGGLWSAQKRSRRIILRG